MPFDPQGQWFPSIGKRQAELLAESDFDILDVEGPRKSTKTVGCCHRLARHLWDCSNARAIMVGKTLTVNYDGGTWPLMVEHVLPEWIESGIGMEWVTRPAMSSLTHKMTCEVSNRHGTVSRLQLESLQNEHKVESIFKSRMHSCVYMTEAANFKRRSSFDNLLQTLRGYGEDWQQHFLFMIDCNPAEEGESHWIYQLFHKFRLMTEAELKVAFPKLWQAMLLLRNRLKMYRFQVSDNIWLSDDKKAALEAEFALSGQDTYDRHWLGLWKKSASDTAFGKVFNYSVHVRGQEKTIVDPNPEILWPSDGCDTFYVGYDLGDIHNAIIFGEKIMLGNDDDSQPTFNILDELVLIDTPIKMEDLTAEVLEIMFWWERQLGRRLNFIHWADSSAISGFDNITGSNEAKEIFRASSLAGREIELVGVTKGPNSVVKRIQLIRRLLYANRLFISARCEQLIQTMTMLKTNSSGSLKRSGEPLRHAFDAMSYMISMEAWSELQMDLENRLGKPTSTVFQTG